MASLQISLQLFPLLHRPSTRVPKSSLPLLSFGKNFPGTPLNFRCKNEVRLQVKQRLHPVFASETNPSDGSTETKSSDAAQGPPFLTILAGLFVFAFICWIVGSVVMWIINLIVHPSPLK